MLKKQNGITLIALIITVIVMLILVGVTINVALNGGLFGKAEEATKQTQLAADKEELQMEIVTAYNEKEGIVNLETLATNLRKKGWTVTVSGDIATCKSPKDNVFTVDKSGKIGNGENPQAFDWSTIGFYVEANADYRETEGSGSDFTLNFTEDGKLLVFNYGDLISTIDATKEDIEIGRLSYSFDYYGEETNVIVTMNETNEDVQLTIEGMDAFTLAKVAPDNSEVYTHEEVLKLLDITENTGTYTGTWTVIEKDEEGNPTKLVSTRSVTAYKLGEEGNLDKCISDYKNAVNLLNTAAQEATGITDARSITVEDIETLAGIQDSDKGDNYNKEYTYNYTNNKDQIFVDESGTTVKLDSEGKEVTLKHTDYSYDLTEDQKTAIKSLAYGKYWFASPCVSCNSNYAYFEVRCMRSGYIGSCYYLFISSGGRANNESYGVRAVVSI